MAEREVFALMADDPRGIFYGGKIPRRDVGKSDVNIEIHYCGICHSDYHAVKSEWAGTKFYPMVPGHEIVGVVISVGVNVKKFKAGDRVGVGCLVDSCRTCNSCKEGLENYCLKGWLATYNGEDSKSHTATFGGYSEAIVVDEHFVVKVPDGMDLAHAAPILCAGITMYSALKSFAGLVDRKKVAIIGLGGLGEMGVKLAKAMGHDVTVISSSNKKKQFAEAELGVKFVNSSNENELKALSKSINVALSTIPSSYDCNLYMDMMAVSGNFCCIGCPPENFTINAATLIFNRLMMSGSLIGGLEETQEVLDFCAKENILPTIELIGANANDIMKAFVELGNVASSRQRYVIDMRRRREGPADIKTMEMFRREAPKHVVNSVSEFKNSFETTDIWPFDYAGKTYDPKNDTFL